MLHTKFRGYRPTGSGEEDFEGFLYGRGGHLGWSSSCYIPSFVEIGLSVLEKKTFEGYLPYMGMAAILVM